MKSSLKQYSSAPRESHMLGDQKSEYRILKSTDQYSAHRNVIFNEDSQFWWETTSKVLQGLLSHASYNTDRQRRAMEMYEQLVVHNLGPRPDSATNQPRWESFMTDDFSPLEFSWNWGDLRKRGNPTIRFCFEAIGKHAGTSADLANSSCTLNLLSQLQSIIPGADLQHFNYFATHLLPNNHIPLSDITIQQHGYRSSIFLGFEFVNEEPTVKAYFMPLAKALQTSQSISEVICETLENVPGPLKNSLALSKLVFFLKNQAPSLDLVPFLVAVDCVLTSISRIKVYTRCQKTSFASVAAIITLFEEPETISKGMRDLRELWNLVLGLQDGLDLELPLKSHTTSGIAYNFEVNPKSNKINTKLYIPVRHYSHNDQVITEGLVGFLRNRSNFSEAVLENYVQALKDIGQYRRLDSGCGLHTYISCSIKDDALSITSYISPEIYHAGRYADLDSEGR